MILSSLSIYLITAAIALFLTIAISMMLRRFFRPKEGPRGGPRGAPRALQRTMIVAPAPTATNPPVADAVAVATNSASTEVAIVVRPPQRGRLTLVTQPPPVRPPLFFRLMPDTLPLVIREPHARPRPGPGPGPGPGPWCRHYGPPHRPVRPHRP